MSAFAQKKIELSEVSKHVGDSVKVEGKIFGVKSFPGGKNAKVLLNLGADFPNQLLTVAVYDGYKTENVEFPTEKFKGEIAIVTGKIELYKGKPQIVVRSPDQLLFVAADPVTVPIQQ